MVENAMQKLQLSIMHYKACATSTKHLTESACTTWTNAAELQCVLQTMQVSSVMLKLVAKHPLSTSFHLRMLTLILRCPMRLSSVVYNVQTVAAAEMRQVDNGKLMRHATIQACQKPLVALVVWMELHCLLHPTQSLEPVAPGHSDPNPTHPNYLLLIQVKWPNQSKLSTSNPTHSIYSVLIQKQKTNQARLSDPNPTHLMFLVLIWKQGLNHPEHFDTIPPSILEYHLGIICIKIGVVYSH